MTVGCNVVLDSDGRSEILPQVYGLLPRIGEHVAVHWGNGVSSTFRVWKVEHWPAESASGEPELVYLYVHKEKGNASRPKR